eukprot:g9024.t1
MHSGNSSQVSPPATVAAGAVSTLAVTGVIVTTVSTLFGGAAAGVEGAAAGSPPRGRGNLVSGNPWRPDNVAGGQNTARSSLRRPSATLAFVVIAQIQFLATLSLVSRTGGAIDSRVSSFAENLRWVNLWPPQSFAESYTPTGAYGEESSTGGELEPGQQDDDAEGDVSAGVLSGISSTVFMGNLVLFVAILAGIFVVHIALAAGVEAYWIARKRAAELFGRARSMNIPLSELWGDPSGRRIEYVPNTESSQRSFAVAAAREGAEDHTGGGADEERGQPAATRKATRLNMRKIAECRERSQSAWLHFPHVELVFLLFAFEGAVSAQVAAVRENPSALVFILAISTFVLYPVLMIVMVSRSFLRKVRPDDDIVFKAFSDDDENTDQRTRGFAAKVKSSLRENHSMFSWANKGQWESVETPDAEVKQERDWFRIGFEPLFVDFTKKGAWFVVYSLIEWAALGVVVVVVDNSVVQLSLFCAMHSVSFLLLVVFKPFANWVINVMGTLLYGIDAVCMALLAVSTGKWEGTSRAKGVDMAVMITQIVTLAALIIPIYVDTSFMMVGAIGRKLTKAKQRAAQPKDEEEEEEEEEEERAFTARYVRTSWARTWCTMLGKNILACLRDTAAGVDAISRRDTTARTGPHPALAPSDDEDGQEGFQARRLGSNTVGTVDTPLIVLLSPRSEVTGQEESVSGAITSTTLLWHEDSNALRHDGGGSQHITAAEHGGNAVEGAHGSLEHHTQADPEGKNPIYGVGPTGLDSCSSSSVWLRFATTTAVTLTENPRAPRQGGGHGQMDSTSEIEEPPGNKWGATSQSDLPRRRHMKYSEYSARSPTQAADGSSFAPEKKPAEVEDSPDWQEQQREHVLGPDATDAISGKAFHIKHHPRSRTQRIRGGVRSVDLPRRREVVLPEAANVHRDNDEKEGEGLPRGQSIKYSLSVRELPPVAGADGETHEPRDDGSGLDPSELPMRSRPGNTNSGRFGLGRAGPIASDIPRRHPGFDSATFVTPTGGGGATIGQPPSSSDNLGDNDYTKDGQGDQGAVDPEADDALLDGTSRTRGASSSLADSMRRALGGAVEEDHPRRQFTKYSLSTGEDVSPDAGTDEETHEPRDDGSGSDPSMLALMKRRMSRGMMVPGRILRRARLSFWHRSARWDLKNKIFVIVGQFDAAGARRGVEDDVPRRRPSKYSLSGEEDVVRGFDACTDGDGQQDDDEARSHMSTSGKESGDSWRFGLSKEHIANDIPRRRSDFSSRSDKSVGSSDVGVGQLPLSYDGGIATGDRKGHGGPEPGEDAPTGGEKDGQHEDGLGSDQSTP